MAQRYARITGWGKYLPPQRLTNYDLEQMLDTTDEWINSHTGIRERRIAAPDVTTMDLAAEASQRALEKAGIRAEDVDMIIVATSTPDYHCPSAGSILQDKIGAKNAAAFDMMAGCTGSLYGLIIATQFIQTGAFNRILVVGAEKLSGALDWTDRSTCVLFGDGAAALVVEPSMSPTGILSFEMGSDSTHWDALIYPAGGAANPFSQEVLDNRENYLRVDGKRVARFALRHMVKSIQNVVQRSGLPFDDIDLIIPHQSNTRLIEMAMKRLKVSMDKVMVNVDRYANTSAAAVMIALVEAAEQERISDGNHIVLVSFGAGLTWAAAVVHWEPTRPEGEAMLVADWPIRERLRRQAIKVRSSVWSARVSARGKVQEASTAVMVPLYSWQRRRRKAQEERQEETD